MINTKDLLYYRYIIQKCVELGKFLVVEGEYNGLCTRDMSKFTFRNLKPYLPDTYNTSIIADHVNLRKSECTQYIQESSFIKGHKFIIVAKPYIYKNKNGDIKGGLVLSNELEKFGLRPITFYSMKYIQRLPYNLIIDFRKEFNGIYGWKKPTRYNIVLSSEQQLLHKNTNPNKLSFSISYSEKLDNKKAIPNISDINLLNDEEEITHPINIFDTENIYDNMSLFISDDTRNKNMKTNLNNQKINVEDNNIVIEDMSTKNQSKDLDSSIAEFAAIKAPDILLQFESDLIIPPCRRK